MVKIKQIVGIEKGINKKYNTQYTILHTITDFSEYEKTNKGAIGDKVEATYIRGNIECNLGDTVEFEYQPGFNNEAVVSGVKKVK